VYGLIVKATGEPLRLDTLPELARARAPVTLIQADRFATPFLHAGEEVDVVAATRPRPGDFVIARAGTELLTGWARAPVDGERWHVRHFLTGLEARAVPVARAVRLRKQEGPFALDAPLGRALGAALARAGPATGRALLEAFAVGWRLAHPLWPPLWLGPEPEVLRRSRRAYREPATVTLYDAAGDVLTPEELQVVDRFKPGSRILDVGCGAGREAVALARLGHRVMAVDVSPELLGAARRRAAREGVAVAFVQASIDALEFRPGAFDGVLVSAEVYSYIPGRARRVETLRRLARAMTDEAPLLLFQWVSVRHPLGRSRLVDALRRLARAVGAGPVSEPGDAWTYEGTYGPVFKHHFFSAAELHGEIEAAGLRVENVIETCRVCRRRG